MVSNREHVQRQRLRLLLRQHLREDVGEQAVRVHEVDAPATPSRSNSSRQWELMSSRQWELMSQSNTGIAERGRELSQTSNVEE